MPEPIVFISQNRIKEGKLDDLKNTYREATELIKATKPGTVVFLGYINEEATEASFVHVFPDQDSFDLHMEGVGERVKRASEFLQTYRYEIYGTPSDRVLERMSQFAGSTGAALNARPQPLGGYLRLESG